MQFDSRFKAASQRIIALGNSLFVRVRTELDRVVDRERWVAALTWRQRAAAISAPRAAILGGAVGAVAAAGVIMLWPDPRPHAPRLPVQQELAASASAAAAMEADLSPALMAANQSQAVKP